MARMRSPSRSSTALRCLRASSSRRVVSRWRSRVAWSASWLALNCSTTVSTWSFMWSIAAWTSAAWLRRRASFCAGVSALATLTPTPARATPATSSRPSTERALRRPRTIERAAGRPLRRWGGRRTTCNSGLLSGWGICSGGGQRVPQGWFWTICRTGGLGGWRAQPYRRLGLMTNRGPRRAGQTGAEAGKMERRAVAPGGRDRPRAAEVARMIQRARGTRAGPCGSGAGSAHEVLRCCGGARRDPPAVVARRAGDAPVDRLVAVDHVGDVDRVAGLARRLDRQVRGLLRVHAPEEQAEVLLAGLVGVLVHGDAVVDH